MKPIIMIFGLLMFVQPTVAQEGNQQFYSHQDIVKPSMNAAYVNFLKKVKDAYQKHNVDANWRTLAMDDNSYIFFSPIKNFDIGAVHKTFTDAREKFGAEAYAKLWAEKGNYIESHNEFILQKFYRNTIILRQEKVKISGT